MGLRTESPMSAYMLILPSSWVKCSRKTVFFFLKHWFFSPNCYLSHLVMIDALFVIVGIANRLSMCKT